MIAGYVMGVDIAYGAPGAVSARYAAVVLSPEGRLVKKLDAAPLARIIRLAWTQQLDIVAVDNIFELGRSEGDIIRIISLFPPRVRFVQVTLESGHAMTLREVAERYGLKVEGKPSPTATAFIIAQLALKGAGTVVSALEEKTIISVSRGRGGKSGGWSQQRYQRRVRAAIASAVNRIREALDRAGLDYDIRYRKSEGGIESATFTVYASRDKLYGVVKPESHPDYVVRVTPSYRTRVTLLAEGGEARGRPLIVGLDPGITTGVVVLDISGRLVYAESGKNLDRSKITEAVYKLGKPIIVAVDVSNPPETAKKLAAQWGATLYTPPVDLTTAEKRMLARKVLGDDVGDNHVRDAAAAAYKAYQSLKAKLNSIEKALERIDFNIEAEKVKMEVVKGASLAEAIEKIIEEKLGARESSEKESGPTEAVSRGGDGGLYREIDELQSQIEALKIENASLRRELSVLESKLRRLNSALESERMRARERLYKEKELAVWRQRVSTLEETVRRLGREVEEARKREEDLRRALSLVGSGRYMVAIPLERLTVKAVREALSTAKDREAPLILELKRLDTFTWDAVEELASSGVEAVIAEYPDSPPANAIKSRGVPVFSPSEAGVMRVAGYTLVSRNVLKLVEEFKEEVRRARMSRIRIERIVEEYRLSRRSGLKEGS